MPEAPLTAKQAQALVDLYTAADESVRAALVAALENGAVGTAAYRARRLTAIQQALSDLQDKAIPLSTELVTTAYIGAAREAAKEVRGSVADFGTGFHKDAIELLADNVASGLNGAAETVGRRVADLFREVGLRAASQGLAEAATLREASSFLANALRNPATVGLPQKGVTAFVDAAGRTWSLERYSEMVIRTTTREAVVQARINTFLENGNDLVVVDASGDACDICAPFAGNTYSLTGSTDGYDTLDNDPPWHPNCMCDLRAETSTLEAEMAAL